MKIKELIEIDSESGAVEAHDKHFKDIEARLTRLEANGERLELLLEDICDTGRKLLEVLAANYERQMPPETLQAWFEANEIRVSALEAFARMKSEAGTNS